MSENDMKYSGNAAMRNRRADMPANLESTRCFPRHRRKMKMMWKLPHANPMDALVKMIKQWAGR